MQIFSYIFQNEGIKCLNKPLILFYYLVFYGIFDVMLTYQDYHYPLDKPSIHDFLTKIPSVLTKGVKK